MANITSKAHTIEGDVEHEATSTIEISDCFLPGGGYESIFALTWDATIRAMQLAIEVEYPELQVPWERRNG